MNSMITAPITLPSCGHAFAASPAYVPTWLAQGEVSLRPAADRGKAGFATGPTAWSPPSI